MNTLMVFPDNASRSSDDERPPTHLLRILPENEVNSQLIEHDMITNRQAMLFKSQ